MRKGGETGVNLFFRCIIILKMRPAFLTLLATVLAAQEYALGPESTTRAAGVMPGRVSQHKWTSKIFPGTERDYWIYSPAQYKGEKPYPVMIFQDGGGFVSETGHSRLPIVFDNLIHTGDLPPMVGIFVNPGVLPARNANEQARFNRSFEYDALGDRYARFLIEELLPEVAKTVNISSDPNQRGIGGSSSGAIAAFNAAWQRPDAFRRVLSFIGSYTNLRGGEELSSLVRKYENKPLRVFLQDGNRDNNIYGGSWWHANQDLAASFEFSGYDYKFVTGTEQHNMKHGGAIMPGALRWLWRGYPQPITPGDPQGERHMAKAILGSSQWELVASGYRFSEGPAVRKTGEVFFTDIPNSRIHRIGLDGKVTVFKEDTGGANGLMFGPDDRLYACQNGRKRIVAYALDGQETAIAEEVSSNDLVVTPKGDIYFTDPLNKQVWFIPKGGQKRVVYKSPQNGGIEFPNGIAASPDQSLIMVADYRGKWIWSFQVQPDGSLDHGQPFFRLETPDDSSVSYADGMTVDSEGFVYVATRVGLQICDPPGRVNAIAANPDGQRLSNAVFAGPELDTLYVSAGDKVYKRKILRHGFWPWQVSKPVAPRL